LCHKTRSPLPTALHTCKQLLKLTCSLCSIWSNNRQATPLGRETRLCYTLYILYSHGINMGNDIIDLPHLVLRTLLATQPGCYLLGSLKPQQEATTHIGFGAR
jgi:hypothetical protein